MPEEAASGDALDFTRLEATARIRGPGPMLEELAAWLVAAHRWHALFDVRMVQARLSVGLPLTTNDTPGDESVRALLDERSLAACREVGHGLLADGQVAAAWMYLRAAAPAEAVAERLAPLAARVLSADAGATPDEDSSRLVDELLGVALWEAVDPALGIEIMLRTQGICAAITAFEQTVSRLPARRQEPAARRLVNHLHGELVRAVAESLDRSGIDPSAATHGPTPLAALLESAVRAGTAPAIHVDVSHLQSVLRIARVCSDEATLRQAWELAGYACRLPPDVTYPGEPPFENVGEASRLFFAASLGIDVAAAVAFFRRAAARSAPEQAGTLPGDVLVLLLTRAGRPGEALHEALSRRGESAAPSGMQAAGQLPSLIELASASGEWELLLDACRRHGDAITFAAAVTARGA
jgi:hypothetical protein